jgi:autotransporter-associated beta strand protein
LNTNRTARGILFDSTTRNYTLSTASSSGLTLDNTANNAAATIVDSSVGAGSHAINLGITLNSNLAVLVTNDANTLTIGGAISGSDKSLTKSGAGTLALTDSSTYTGATSVSSGKLVVNGNISTSFLTTVAVNATLAGSGTVGAATINGILAPGNSIGTLNATGDVTWNDNDAWVFELGSAASSLALANTTIGLSDLLNITGGGNDFLKGTGSSFTFDFAGGGSVGWYKLVDWESTTTFVAEDFVAFNLGSGLSGTFTVDSGTSALYVNVIPEPRAALLGGLGMLALLRRRRSA